MIFNNYTEISGNEYLLTRLAMAYPELVEQFFTEDENTKTNENQCPCANCPFNNLNEEYEAPTVKLFNFTKTYKELDLGDEFERALRKLNKYNKQKYGYKPLYDFRLPDGTPVKEYQNFIQVGYKLIPKNGMCNYIRNLRDRDRANIVNVILMINNIVVNQ